MSPRKYLLNILADDIKWKRFKNIVTNAIEPEFDNYIEELRSIHRARPLRGIGLSPNAPTGKKLSKAAMTDQSYRSRCVELVINVILHRDVLQEAINIIKKHIEGTYSDDMKKMGLRGITERRTLVNSLVAHASKILADMNTIITISDLITEDIDKASYATQHSVKALETAMKREKSF